MSKRPFEYLKSLFGSAIEKKSVALSDSTGLESIFGAPNTIAGPAISAATALRVPAVFSATVLLSSAVGSLPAKVFYSSPSDGKRTADDHAAYRLVHDEANDFTSAGQLRSQLTADALLHDHGYALANRVEGRAIEFIRLEPRSVTVKADERTGEPVYEHRVGNIVSRYGYRDILHISAPLGMSPIKAGREAIGLAKVMEEHAASLFANRARPGSIIKVKRALGEDARRKLAQAWNAAFGKSGNGGTVALDDDMDHQTVDAMTSADAEFTATRNEQIVEIARVFRIPPHLLYDMSRATWANAEEMGLNFFNSLSGRGSTLGNGLTPACCSLRKSESRGLTSSSLSTIS